MDKKFLYLLLVSGTLLFSNGANLKKVVIIDKRDLAMYLSNSELKNKKSENTNISRKKIVVKINSYDDYVSNIDSSNKKIINMSLIDLLLSTRYLFENKKSKKMYQRLKPLLLKKAKKYKMLDYYFFKEDAENMNLKIVNELIKVVGELDNE